MEHEITGHARKAYKISQDPYMSFWKKAREILFEILIIVFAISLAAFLERRREHSNEQKQVKEFLVGLKTDLQSDIQEMTSDKKSFIITGKAFHFFSVRWDTANIEKDSVNLYLNKLFSSTSLIPNSGRYEGFKSSGRTGSIENAVLQNDILDLYQENIPSLLATSAFYNDRQKMLLAYFMEHQKTKPNGSSNFLPLLLTDQARNIAGTLVNVNQILERYDTILNKSQRIIAEIDKEYPEERR